MNKIKMIITVCLLVLLLLIDGYIIYQSLLEGAVSSKKSETVTEVVVETVDKVTPGDTSIKDKYTEEEIHAFIRKLVGHFGLCFVSGGLCVLFLICIIKRYYWTTIIAFSHGLFLSIITEVLQLTKEARTGSFKDSLIDMAGFSLPIIILIGYVGINHIIKRRKENEQRSTI